MVAPWAVGASAALAAAAAAGPPIQAPASRTVVALEAAVAQAVRGGALEAARLTLANARVTFEKAAADNLLAGSPLADQVARNDLRKAELDFRNSHFQAVSAVVTAYIDVLTASEQVRAADLQRRIAASNLEAARQKAKAGLMGSLELQQAENSALSAAQGLAEAQVGLDEALAALAEALGYPDTVPTAEQLAVPDPVPALPSIEVQQAIATAVQRSGEVAWRNESLEIARKQLQQAQAEQAPPLDVRAREYAVRTAEIQLRQARLDLERSVRLALARAGSAAQRLELARRSLEVEQQRLDGVRQQQRAGLKTELDVLQADLAVSQARQSYLNAVKGYLTALLELRRLLGEEPGFGPPTSELAAMAGVEGAGSGR